MEGKKGKGGNEVGGFIVEEVKEGIGGLLGGSNNVRNEGVKRECGYVFK